jgi:hypothetical protein
VTGDDIDRTTVFYSWQSDLDEDVTKSFVERCLEEACKCVGNKIACKLVVDQDGRDEAGSPEIPDAVQRKILRAVAFVADLSIVKERTRGRGLTNSCVAFEWGWAEQALGSEAMIGVMNTAYGSPEDLPIDIRQNLIRTTYLLNEEADDETKKSVARRFADDLSNELEGAVTRRYFYGLHPLSRRLIPGIIKSSEHGLEEELDVDKFASEYGISVVDVAAIGEDLQRLGLATLEVDICRGPCKIQLSPKIFERFDPLYMGWSAERDSMIVARHVAERGEISPSTYAEELGWQPRRLNPAIFRLVRNGLVLDSEIWVGESPFSTAQVNRNESTRAFAEGRLRVSSVLDK